MMNHAVNWAVYRAIHWAVHEAVCVAVDGAVYWGVDGRGLARVRDHGQGRELGRGRGATPPWVGALLEGGDLRMMNHAVNWAVYEAMGLWGGNDTVSQAVNRAVTKRGKLHPGLGVYLAAVA